MELLGFVLAALVGLSLGMLGGGGSILMVPILVYLLGFGTKTAIAMSLPIVGATSLVGALGHWRAGNVRLPAALGFGVATMAGSFAGARLAAYVSGTVQLAILALVMLAAAVSMARSGTGGAGPAPGTSDGMSARLLGAAAGAGVGVLTGVVGIGGGFLIVPALVLLLGVPMKQAVGTSLVVIAMSAAAGSAGYLGRVAVPWDYVAGFTGIAILGILTGTALVRYVPQGQLKRAFAAFLVVIGLLTLYQNRTALGLSRHEPAAATPKTLRADDGSSSLGRT
jgi:uncharacterized membrane protein YfcA